jgi:hypothetical protein
MPSWHELTAQAGCHHMTADKLKLLITKQSTAYEIGLGF